MCCVTFFNSGCRQYSTICTFSSLHENYWKAVAEQREAVAMARIDASTIKIISNPYQHVGFNFHIDSFAGAYSAGLIGSLTGLGGGVVTGTRC